MNPRVFLIAEPSVRHNGEFPTLTPLAEYGDIKTVIPSSLYVSRHPDTAMQIIQTKMKDFDPERDYLVWAGGDTLGAVLVGAFLYSHVPEGVKIRWLRWQRNRDKDGKRTESGGTYQLIENISIDRTMGLEDYL
jgi:hypothetical protein